MRWSVPRHYHLFNMSHASLYQKIMRLETLRAKSLQGNTSLLRAFLIAMIVIGLIFTLLAVGIWMYTTDVLEREEAVATRLLPEIDTAFQLTSSTAELQSQAYLLRSSVDQEQLQVRQGKLLELVSQIPLTLEKLQTINPSDRIDIEGDVRIISQLSQQLSDRRSQQIDVQAQIERQKKTILLEMSNLERFLEKQVIQLTAAQLEQSELIGTVVEDESADSGRLDELFKYFIEYDSVSLDIQDYLILGQGVVALSAIVERLPLLADVMSVEQAIQRRDLLIHSLVSRSIYIKDEKDRAALLSAFGDLRARLKKKEGLFDSQIVVLTLAQQQDELGLLVQQRLERILERSDTLRNKTRVAVNQQAAATLSTLSTYRVFLLVLFALALFVLAFISYWLLYRRTVVPLMQVNRQLDDVGRARFATAQKPYFIKELTTLSNAVAQLDAVQKQMNEKDSQLQANVRELKRANEDLEQFAHIASHDLQEPLRKLQQFSDLLVEDYKDKLDEDGRFFLDVIRTASKRMSALIKDTLAYSQSGSSNQTLEEVELKETVAVLLDEMDLAIEDAQATFTIGALPVVYANRLGMEQLFRNLILNAIKYSKPYTSAKIDIRCVGIEAADEHNVLIRVQDNGIGIAEKYLQRIFNPFERLQSGDVPGTGLGLAICMKVCESHEWALQVRSTEGVGTVFEIRIPKTSLVSG